MSGLHTIAPVTPAALEAQLRNLHTTAVFFRAVASREIWRVRLQDKAYELWFYPRGGKRGLSRLAGGTAASDFANLQLLQDRKVPALRAVAMLAGFRFGDRIGDAVLVDPGDTPTRLDDVLFRLSDAPIAGNQHRQIVRWLTDLLRKLGTAKLGHAGLSPEAFAVGPNGLRLCEPTGVTREGLTETQLWQAAHAFAGIATTADRVRVFRALTPEAKLPLSDPRGAKRYRDDRKTDSIESIRVGDWQGRFRRSAVRPAPWSTASKLTLDAADWQREWPLLIERVEAGQVEVLKSDASGDVLASEVRLAGRPIQVVIKRPLNKYFYRRVLAITRASRALRMWEKTVALHLRHLPVEYPLVVMQRRRFGYVVEAVAIFERVSGDTLADADLAAMTAGERDRFFFRCGRAMRRIEETGLAHPDAKSTNWIVFREPNGRPTPVMLDAYGVRPLTSFMQLRGLRRLLRAMRLHPQYTPADSLEICRGFAPRAAPVPEDDA